MKRQRDELQVNMAGLRRNLKNLAHNYSDAQVKVREATSNDPWGPSSTLMSDIADLTYNVVAFTEIMHMIWKRLNDHGRNWRHVYKALVLLEYLIKTGSEKVAQQCKENIFAIQTLRDFQYIDDGKDQGLNVREKAKLLVLLLRDDDRLKNERARALKAKERFAQSASGFGSDTAIDAVSPSSPSFSSSRSTWNSTEDSASRAAMEFARPQTAGEEELQLQLALAMSREEAEQEEQKRRSDDVRLQLALSQSENEFKQQKQVKDPPRSHILDLLDVSLNTPTAPAPNIPSSDLSGALGATSQASVDPWGMPLPPPARPQQADPWSASTTTTSSNSDPWSPAPTQQAPPKPVSVPSADPWKPAAAQAPVAPAGRGLSDPWSPVTADTSPPSIASPQDPDSDFDMITNRDRNSANMLNNNKSGAGSPNPFDMTGMKEELNGVNGGTPSGSMATKRSPHSFLGENSSLVNLDNLVTKPAAPSTLSHAPPPIRTAIANPFSPVGGIQPTLQPGRTAVYPLNPIKPEGLPQPLMPQPPPAANPFLS